MFADQLFAGVQCIFIQNNYLQNPESGGVYVK